MSKRLPGCVARLHLHRRARSSGAQLGVRERSRISGGESVVAGAEPGRRQSRGFTLFRRPASLPHSEPALRAFEPSARGEQAREEKIISIGESIYPECTAPAASARLLPNSRKIVNSGKKIVSLSSSLCVHTFFYKIFLIHYFFTRVSVCRLLLAEREAKRTHASRGYRPCGDAGGSPASN